MGLWQFWGGSFLAWMLGCVAAGTIAAQVTEFCSCRGWKGPQLTEFNLTAKAGPAVGGCPNGSGVSP